MPQFSDVVFQLDDHVSFTSDIEVPEDLQNQTFRVAQTNTLILNDFYFNNEVFTCYELKDEANRSFLVTPFCFEGNDQKIRLSKRLTPQEIQALFPQTDPKIILGNSTNSQEAQTIDLEKINLPDPLKPWFGHSYYIDLKGDQEPASSFYVNYDPKQKKNLNPTLLLAKYPYQQYTLFQGDYALYFLEANFNAPDPLLATLFLDGNCLQRN